MRAAFAETPPLARPDAATLPPALASRRPRVCFLAPTTWPLLSRSDIPVMGGAELQQTVVATALARRGFDVSMVSLDYGQSEGAVVEGVRVHKMHTPDEGIPVIRFAYPRFAKLWQALKRADADVYYQRTAAVETGFLAAFCRKHKRRSIFAGASDVDFMPDNLPITFARDRWIYSYGLRNVDAIFAQNPCQRDNVQRHYGREALLVPNCYAAPPGSKADPQGYLLWIATVRAQKRPEVFIEMARRMPQHRFVLAGGNDPDRRGREYARGVREAAAMLPNVTVHEFVPFHEAERLFDGARVVLNTSTYEGFPNVFLQAWARGIPTVSFVDTGSRHRGAPVYEVASDFEHACRIAGELLGDDAAWQRASARVAEHFRECHSVESVTQVYEREILRLAALPA